MPSEEMEVVVQKKKLDDLANIIAAKSGNDVPLTLDEMIDAAYDTASEPNLQKKTIKPTEKKQVVKADNGYDGLGEVEVGAVSGTYVGSRVPRQYSLDQNGQYIYANAGYYPEETGIGLQTTDAAVPTISINSTTGVITAETTQSIGYISSSRNISTTMALPTIEQNIIYPSDTEQVAADTHKYTLGDIKVEKAELEIATVIPNETLQTIYSSNKIVLAKSGTQFTYTGIDIDVTNLKIGISYVICGGIRTGGVEYTLNGLIYYNTETSMVGGVECGNHTFYIDRAASKAMLSNVGGTVTKDIVLYEQYGTHTRILSGGSWAGTIHTGTANSITRDFEYVNYLTNGDIVHITGTGWIGNRSKAIIINQKTIYSQKKFEFNADILKITLNEAGDSLTISNTSTNGHDDVSLFGLQVSKITPAIYGLSSVTVNPIPPNYVGSAIPQKSSSDLTVSDNIVTAPHGYYAENASIHVSPTGDTFEVNALNIYNEGDYTAPSGTMYNSVSVKTTPRIKFYDFDGTLLYDYSAAEIVANGALPATIAQSGLVVEGWNWSYQDVIDCLELYPDDDIEIGQICKSSDRWDHLFVNIPETNLTLTLAFTSTTTIDMNTLINFGDPVSNTYNYSNNGGYKTITHQYSTPGIYEISFAYSMSLYSSSSNEGGSTAKIAGTTNCLNNSKEQMIIKYISNDTGVHSASISNSPFLNATTVTMFNAGSLYNCSGIQYIIANSLKLGSFQRCTSLKKAILGYRTANFDTASPHSIFYYCSNLTKVFLYPKTTAIPNGTFAYCNKLNKINDLYNLYRIGQEAFYQCSSLNHFFFSETLKTIDQSAFYGSGISEVHLSNIETLANYCFANCNQLQTVVITSEQLTDIPAYCFSRCDKLYNVTLPRSITSIKNEAFRYCGFTHILLPDSLQSIGTYAFSSCPYLQSIEFADSIMQIGDGCFQDCALLKKIVIKNNTPPSIGNNVFNIVSSMKIYVPASSVEAYKTATGWSTYADYIEAIPE